MGNRKRANRAEAIVKGIGVVVLLLLALVVARRWPDTLQGREPQEMLAAMIRIITLFAIVAGAIGILGLLVWIWFRKRR